MTKEELIENLKRTGEKTFESKLYSKFFNREIKLLIFSGDSTDEEIVISDYLMSCIDDVIEYDKSEIETIQEDVYNDYKIAIKGTDFGIVPDELYFKHKKNSEKANQELFNIKNPQEAFESLSLNYASVVEYSTKRIRNSKERYVGFFLERKWDSEHELQIVTGE